MQLKKTISAILAGASMVATAQYIDSPDGTCREYDGIRYFKTLGDYEMCTLTTCRPWVDLSKNLPPAAKDDCRSCCYYISPDEKKHALQKMEEEMSMQSTRTEKSLHFRYLIAVISLALLSLVSIVFNAVYFMKRKQIHTTTDGIRCEDPLGERAPFAAALNVGTNDDIEGRGHHREGVNDSNGIAADSNDVKDGNVF